MNLPPPAAPALASSAALLAHIQHEIEAAGGWLPFSRHMALALYTPGLGYYSGGAAKFGAEGDFITAPMISPLFARALARQLAPMLANSAPHLIEAGAGTGLLAAQLLCGLEKLGALPERYDILEVSGELAARQRATLMQHAAHLIDRVRWLDHLPERFSGVVLGNEVLDALPFERVCWQEGNIECCGVALENGALVWQNRPAQGALLAAAQALDGGLPRPYTSEIPLAACDWVRQWGSVLQQGALLLFDYGFPRHEFYHPQRASGTLMCHYRHHAHHDPLLWPGLNDITTHLDFTALAEAAVEGGLEVLGYTSQATFLLNCGVLEIAPAPSGDDAADHSRASHALNMLLSPAEMGELFKVIALGRGMGAPLMGFARGDRVHRL